MLPPPCECCTPSCGIASDNFSVDDLATNWSVRTGTPTISGGLLNAGAGANLVIHNTASSASATGVLASVVVRCTSTTDTMRLVAGYVDDNNYWYAEAQAGVSNGTLKLFERSGGTDTQRGSTATVSSFQTNEDWELRLCLQPGAVTTAIFISGSSSATQSISFSASATVASTKAGVGGTEVGTVTFNDFTLEKQRADGALCRTCQTCAPCSTGAPYQVQVVISGAACCPGTYILLPLAGTPCQWELTPACGGRLFLWKSSGTNLQLIESTVGIKNWNATVANPTDCMAWNGLVLTPGGAACPGSTATITTLS